MSLKRIFKNKVADFLIENGAELKERKKGEVKERPDLITYLFINDGRLSEALDKYHAVK